MAAFQAPKLDRLPRPDLRDKAKDNRLVHSKKVNDLLGLLPLDRLNVTHGALDEIVMFDLPSSITPNIGTRALPTASNPPLPVISATRFIPSGLYNEIKKLPEEVQKKLKTIKTKYTPSPHQAVCSTVASIPLGFALAPTTISVYSSYFLTFLSWWEWQYQSPSTAETTYTTTAVFDFCRDLVRAEYNDPLIYFNVILSILAQSRTPQGRRYLEADFVTQLDIESHRKTLHNYKRKYRPDQAPLISKSLFADHKLTPADGALLLLWVYTATRISSIDGLQYIASDYENGIESTAHFKVVHMKGSLSNAHRVSLFCNCLDFGAGDLLCSLHSRWYRSNYNLATVRSIT